MHKCYSYGLNMHIVDDTVTGALIETIHQPLVTIRKKISDFIIVTY